jgi:8-oxo-dGTP pyrophosphatase MutT (NUDIX family)
MVTSKSGRRWVFPKGSIEPGQTAGESALMEAWEEAGLVGVLQREPIGSYHYDKLGGTRHVTVFVMQVSEYKHTWPECTLREREWISCADALRRVEEPGLCSLVREAMRQQLRESVEAVCISE